MKLHLPRPGFDSTLDAVAWFITALIFVGFLLACVAHGQTAPTSKGRKHPNDLLRSVVDVGAYCGANRDIVPKGWTRFARIRMYASDTTGGCVHDLYAPADRIMLIYWPLGTENGYDAMLTKKDSELSKLRAELDSLKAAARRGKP